MKLATDLVNAVLIKNGIVPTSINELPVTSLVKPLTQVHLSLYLKTTHLSLSLIHISEPTRPY